MPKHAIAGAAALMLATAPAAWAEIDARTIWSDWQDVMLRLGGTLEAASEDYAGGTLTLEGVTMASEMGASTSSADYGTITMIEQDDGTVRIEIPETIETSSRTEVDGESVEQTTRMEQTDLEIVASETDGVRAYDMTGDTLRVASDFPAPAGEAGARLEMTLTGIETTYRSGIDGDADAFAQDGTAERLDVAFGAPAPEGGGDFAMTYVLDGLEMDVSGTYGDAPDGPVRGLSDFGLTYDGTFTHSGSTLAIEGDDGTGPSRIDGTSASGSVAFVLGEDVLSYTLTSDDATLNVRTANLPVPIEASMAEAITEIALPFGEIGVEKPFGLRTEYRELVLDDALWALFDPTGQLPRDPATLVVDLDGTAVMNVDVFGDPQAFEALSVAPGELKTLSLTQLLLSVAGAELRGSGDLTFPTATPVPQPVGTIELALDGGFALADRLVTMGVIASEQVEFVKGMSGAVARTVGDDQLESTIEFTEGGGITANGLPLR